MLMRKKIVSTERDLVKLLKNFQKENRSPMWRDLFPRFYPSVDEEEVKDVFREKEESDTKRICGKIGVLKKYLKQLERAADSGYVQQFRYLRMRFRGERAFALQLIRCGKELLEKRKAKKGR